MSQAAVRHISTCTIKPHRIPNEEEKHCPLTAWDLPLLSVHYIQKGLLFYKPQQQEPKQNLQPIIDRLKNSLSLALDHFFPLSGRLVTHSDSIFLDCNAAGAEFIQAAAELTVADVLTPHDIPPIVESFFALNEAVNYDGHSLPLLAVQLTELTDGFFIGCSFNHLVGDGASFWHFFNSWSEITRTNKFQISRLPLLSRWFPQGSESPICLPFSHSDEFIERFTLPRLRDRFFHFTSESVSRLKSKANTESQTNKISSFQALSAFVWISLIRARRLPSDVPTTCRFSIDSRSRLNPPLSRDYFGNAIGMIFATATVGELLGNGLGWAAWKLNECVASHDDSAVRGALEEFLKAPRVHRLGLFDSGTVMTGSSPRFPVYDVDFGWGKPVAVRTGQDNKFDNKIMAFAGREGGGSVDLEICLLPDVMNSLESDSEFMDAVSDALL
ncbi:putative acetyltransferase At3g50280 [Tasmannia lanceolata]|uniref:putative acetyltransferase At3g50280 n=1 Tax=Tasmannia lanceolata TaxID=3420 RepID=UPI00406398B5